MSRAKLDHQLVPRECHCGKELTSEEHIERHITENTGSNGEQVFGDKLIFAFKCVDCGRVMCQEIKI